MKKIVLLTSVVSVLSVLSSGSPALAQNSVQRTSSDSELAEIVVTARLRQESLQDVPVAVTAIAPIALANNLATDLSKIAELAPQVSIGRGVNGTGALITIRGISSTSTDAGLDQSISISMDGMQLSRGRVISASMFDVAQVEILQGPQALFFGKNSPAGVISVSSADPTDSFEGCLKAGYEFTANERYAEGAISGPLGETLGARLAFRASKMDGWIRNVAVPGPNPFVPAVPLPGAWAPKTPAGDNLAGRLTLSWKPVDDFDVRLKVQLDRSRENSNGAYVETFCLPPVTSPLVSGMAVPNGDCRKDRVTAQTALPAQLAVNFPYANGGVPYARSNFALVVLNINKTFGDVTLTSNTGYYNQLLQGAHTSDFSSIASSFNVERERYEIVSQELRLNTEFDGPINFMIGGYLERATRHWFGAPDILHVFNPGANNYTTNMKTTDSVNESISAFAQARWNVVEGLELAGGARITHDAKRTLYVNTSNNLDSAIGRTLRPAGLPLMARYSRDDVSPEVTLTWKPDADNMIYAAYKTGYKSGGLANPVLLSATATESSLTFDHEKVRGFEAGYKAELFNRRLRFDIVAYRYKYSGLQVVAFDSVLLRANIGNAASARTTGITSSIAWLAADGLNINANAGYNRARYLSFPGAQCFTGQTAAQGCVGGFQDLSGKALNRAPELTFSFGADYEFEVAEGWSVNLAGNAYRSSSYNAQTDYAAGGQQEAFWRLNASARIKSPGDQFELALVGRNLNNAYYLVYSFNQPFGGPNQYGGVFNRPREVALEGTYRF